MRLDAGGPDTARATEAAARLTVQEYFSAIHAGDTRALARLFSPAATLVGWDEGEMKCVTRERWFAFVEATPSPKSQGAPLDGEILRLEVCGTAAVAKVREGYRRFQYLEFLALLWTGERWEIVNKCYHQFVPRNGAADGQGD